MQQITIKIPGDLLESLDTEADDRGESRSEYLRDVLESRHDADAIRSEYEDRIDDIRAEYREELDLLQTEIDDLETELERLRREKRQILEEREEKKQLARYVEDERRFEQRWREAGIGTRLKWKVFGMPSHSVDA